METTELQVRSTKSTIRQERTTKKKVILLKTLANKSGNISEACKAAAVSRDVYYEWLKADEQFKKATEDLKESLVDFAESKHIECMQDKNFQAIKYFLENKGKHRGWIDPRNMLPPSPPTVHVQIEVIGREPRKQVINEAETKEIE